MSALGSTVDRLKNPEYTGANRCSRCTAVNAGIGIVLAVALGVGLAAIHSVAAGLVAANAAIVIASASIYFRGYLVPGTPELTKRYFPDDLLSWFGKADADPAALPTDGDGEAVDVEALFLERGLLVECADVDDLCLTDAFRATWRDATVGVPVAAQGQLAAVLETDPGDLQFATGDEGTVSLIRTDGGAMSAGGAATWPSQAALKGDGAAAAVLADEPWFRAFEPVERLALLRNLRLFYDECPDCGGRVALDAETVDSCCSSFDVYAATCEDCEARLLELRE